MDGGLNRNIVEYAERAIWITDFGVEQESEREEMAYSASITLSNGRNLRCFNIKAPQLFAL